MEKQKITIHRGLAELKLIDAKIEKQISEIEPTGFYQKDKLINNVIKLEDFEKSAQSKYDSVIDLIKRKNTIKSAIVKANNTTPVKVGTKTMSIADAINYKTAIQFKKKLADSLKAKQNKMIATVNNSNTIVEANVQKILEATFGKENVKAGKDDVESVRKPYMEANEFHLFDPIKVGSLVEQLELEVSEFEMEVDAALSEINAVTFIEV